MEQQQQNENQVFGMDANRLARGLGWFSIGLGVAELVAPRQVAKLVGTQNHSSLIRLYGVREIAAGVGILSAAQPSGWLWARVAGDVLDLATLGKAAGSGGKKSRTAFGIASVAGVAVLDYCVAGKMSRQAAGETSWARAEASMIVDRSPADCYGYWRNLENLPRFMEHIQSVQITGADTSHWIAEAGGKRVEWDARIEMDEPDRRISWRSLESSDVRNAGSVEFQAAAGNRGTIVRVQMEYGSQFRLLAPLASLLGKDPEQVVRKELRRFKQVMETGEVITTEGQASGRGEGQSHTMLDKIAG